jgi:hypothetical protein
VSQGFEGEIRETLGRLREKTSVIIVCPPEKLEQLRMFSARELLSGGGNGIYVSLSKPYSAINHSLNASGVKTESLFYIDCITTLVHHGKLDLRNPRVFHVSSPDSIAEDGLLPEEIKSFILKVPDPKFILVDTLRTMELYNKPETVVSFIQDSARIAAGLKAKLVVITIHHPHDRVIKEVLPLFDLMLTL